MTRGQIHYSLKECIPIFMRNISDIFGGERGCLICQDTTEAINKSVVSNTKFTRAPVCSLLF